MAKYKYSALNELLIIITQASEARKKGGALFAGDAVQGWVLPPTGAMLPLALPCGLRAQGRARGALQRSGFMDAALKQKRDSVCTLLLVGERGTGIE